MARSNRNLGTIPQHLEKAQALAARAAELHGQGRFAEAVLWAFYSAVHHANARLVQVGRTWIRSHDERDSLMLNDPVLGSQVCYASYRDLKEVSEDARYGIEAIREPESRGALGRLRTISEAVAEALKGSP